MPSQASRVRNYPMLSFVFQMLCEEESIILDIPESIKKSGLTILKGIMETRNDKLWAKFVVEVYIMWLNHPFFVVSSLSCNSPISCDATSLLVQSSPAHVWSVI
mgnify:FL=1